MELVHLTEQVILSVALNPSFHVVNEDSLRDLAMDLRWLRDWNDLLGGSGVLGISGSCLLAIFYHFLEI